MAFMRESCDHTAMAGAAFGGFAGTGFASWVMGSLAGAVIGLALGAAARPRRVSSLPPSASGGARSRDQDHHRELLRRNRELLTFGEITSAMQTTMDVSEVMERVLNGLTEHLGFARAIAGISDAHESAVSGWLAAADGGAAPPHHLLSLDLQESSGVLREALLQPGITMVRPAAAGTEAERRLMAFFEGPEVPVMVVPMRCRGHLVGCLLIEGPPGGDHPDAETKDLLERLADQAGLALANVRLCVERTQKLTLEQERVRIAADLHDSIAQSLFGIVYQLKGCSRLVGPDDDRLREALEVLGSAAQGTLAQVHQVIFDVWPLDPSAALLADQVRQLVRLTGEGPHLTAAIAPEFDHLDIETRKGIFWIAHEAVANVVKHASAAGLWLSVELDAEEVRLTVIDDGVGMTTDATRSGDGFGFGLRGMEDRVTLLGGSLAVNQGEGHGTQVVARLPRVNCRVR